MATKEQTGTETTTGLVEPTVVEKKPSYYIFTEQVFTDLMTFLGALPHNTVKNVITYLEQNVKKAEIRDDSKDESLTEAKQ